MTQALENACEKIVGVLRNVSGIQNVPLNPPSVMSYSTFGLVYPYTGAINVGPIGSRKALHNISIDILSKDVDIARTIKALKQLIDTVSDALLSEVSDGGSQFTGSIETFARLTYSWIPLTDYGGVP